MAIRKRNKLMLKTTGCIGLALMLISCGFKSDLFLPDEASKVEQLDKSMLKNLQDETVERLEGDSVQTRLNSDAETVSESPGVVVELPPVGPDEKDDTQKIDKR